MARQGDGCARWRGSTSSSKSPRASAPVELRQVQVPEVAATDQVKFRNLERGYLRNKGCGFLLLRVGNARLYRGNNSCKMRTKEKFCQGQDKVYNQS